MTIIRTPRPLLATVAPMIARGEPTIEQRLCDAMFARSIIGRGNSPKLLWEVASLRVAEELESAVRQRCRKSQQAWKWKPSQRRSLAAEIVVSAFSAIRFEWAIDDRSRRLIFDALRRINDRHTEVVDCISFEIPTDGVFYWLGYWAVDANKCNAKDRDIMKRALYTCRDVGFALRTWRELCS